MTEIILIRHGETEFNRAGIFRGRCDVALNDRGREQARRLAAALASVPIDAVYSGPLSRALETARPVAGAHDLEPVVDHAFDNIDLGRWQGVRKADVERDEPELWRLWIETPDALRIPGGESLASVARRAHDRTTALVREHEGRRIAIVSHRSVLKLLAGRLLGMQEGYFWKFYLDNAGYSIVRWDGTGFVLTKWNESCHLGERVVEER